MVHQASISDGQLFLIKSAFNPRKANDFLDNALKALNAFWFSWRLASLHRFVLLAVDFLFASCLKRVLKVSLLLRNQRWLMQSWSRGGELWKSWSMCSAGPGTERSNVPCKPRSSGGLWWGRIQLFCWLGNSLPHQGNLPGSEEWWGAWKVQPLAGAIPAAKVRAPLVCIKGLQGC